MKERKKKTYFQKKNFSTPVTISGPDPGPDPGPDSGTDSGERFMYILLSFFPNQREVFFV